MRDFLNRPRVHTIKQMVNTQRNNNVTPGRKAIPQARPLHAFFNAGEQTKRGAGVSNLSALLISTLLNTMTQPPTTSHDLIPLLRGASGPLETVLVARFPLLCTAREKAQVKSEKR